MRKRQIILKRLFAAIPTLFGLSFLIFALIRIIPGAPVRHALGPAAPEDEVQALREEMLLDEPIYVQYGSWLSDVSNGNLGMSLRTRQEVSADILARFPATLELVTLAIILAVLIGVPLGVIAARNKDQIEDHLSRAITLVGVSMPRFWIAILLQILLVVWLGLLPLSGRVSGAAPPHFTGFYLLDSLIAGQWNVFLDSLAHIILPATTLGLMTLANITRLIRTDMLDEAKKDYVMVAQAHGLPTNMITYRYMLRNAFSSSLTYIGLAFGVLLGGAFVIELVFAWPGMARYGVKSVLFQDFNAVTGVVMVVGTAYVFINMAVDVLYRVLDPRIELGDSE